MKTFITGLISCSLLLSAVAMAQQDEEQQKEKKKKSQQTSQAQAQPQATAGAQGGTKRGKGAARHEEHAPTMANSPAATESANVNATQERGKHKGKAPRTRKPPIPPERRTPMLTPLPRKVGSIKARLRTPKPPKTPM
jgi:Ni/Co efflux regulator RcnB